MKMALNKIKPPKNREFLGYVDSLSPYFDFFWWATKADGNDKAGFVDRQFFEMPKLIGWIEVPNVEDI